MKVTQDIHVTWQENFSTYSLSRGSSSMIHGCIFAQGRKETEEVIVIFCLHVHSLRKLTCCVIMQITKSYGQVPQSDDSCFKLHYASVLGC